MAGTPLWILLRTVFQSILQVFLICFAGWVLAKRGVLDKKLISQLNRLNLSIFTPSLLFSKVAFSLSPAKLRELWIIPVFFVIVTSLSFIVAQVLSRLMKLSKMQRNLATAACMFMNSNTLPVALMQSLVMSVPNLEWDDGDDHEDDPTAMLGRALTYLVLFSSLGMILRYSYGISLLSGEDDDSSQDSTLQDEETGYGTNATSPSVREGTLVDISTEEPIDPQPLEPRPPRALSMKKSNSAEEFCQEGYPFSGFNAENTDGLIQHGDGTLSVPTSTTGPTRRFFRNIWSRFRSLLKTITDVMTPPLYASVLSLVVALIPPLQHTLELHTAPIKGALENAGDCSIPLTLVVLGGYFYTPPKQAESSVSSSQVTANGSSHPIHAGDHSAATISLASNLNGSAPAPDASGANGAGRKAHPHSLLSEGDNELKPGETKAVIVALISRMIIVPILMFPLFLLSTMTDWQDVFADPVFVLSCVLLASAPPAVTLAQIASKTSGDAFERLISRIMFWGYCVVTPPATIFYVVLGLWLAKL